MTHASSIKQSLFPSTYIVSLHSPRPCISYQLFKQLYIRIACFRKAKPRSNPLCFQERTSISTADLLYCIVWWSLFCIEVIYSPFAYQTSVSSQINNQNKISREKGKFQFQIFQSLHIASLYCFNPLLGDPLILYYFLLHTLLICFGTFHQHNGSHHKISKCALPQASPPHIRHQPAFTSKIVTTCLKRILGFQISQLLRLIYLMHIL